jgi:hypothetical protein
LKILDFIYGDFYKREENLLHLCLYTDRVPVFKNPSRSAWPVFASIVELPPFLRESRRTKIITGVWFGRRGPSSDILFEQLLENIKSTIVQIQF